MFYNIDDATMMDTMNRQAQSIGYQIIRAEGLGLLFLARTHGEESHMFTNDVQGKQELAGFIRVLTDHSPILDQWSNGWGQWCALPGIVGRWTACIHEHWHPDTDEWLDLRKIEADGTCVWVPRRALATLVNSPRDLQRYQLQLLEQGNVRAVRIMEKNSGYSDSRNPQHLEFFPVAVLLAYDLR